MQVNWGEFSVFEVTGGECAFSSQLLLKEKRVGAQLFLLEYMENSWKLLKAS